MPRTVSVNITNQVYMTQGQEINNLHKTIPKEYVEVREKFDNFGIDEPLIHLQMFASHANAEFIEPTKTTTDNLPIILPPNAKSTCLSPSHSVIDAITNPALTQLASKRKKPGDAVPNYIDVPGKNKEPAETATKGKKGIYQLYTFICCIWSCIYKPILYLLPHIVFTIYPIYRKEKKKFRKEKKNKGGAM